MVNSSKKETGELLKLKPFPLIDEKVLRGPKKTTDLKHKHTHLHNN
jgi:hypothetical protein